MLHLRIAALALLSVVAQAAVSRVEVAQRQDLPLYGYERVTGKVHFAVDPKLPRNRAITDIDLAPRNAQGLVEFSADLYILRPKDPAKGNGTTLFEVSNRGSRGLLSMFDLVGGGDLATPRDFGEPLLFEQGFTMVWVGWEWDVADQPNLLKLYAPRIPGVTGTVMSQIIVNRKSTSESLGDRTLTPYLPASNEAASLTVRNSVTGPRTLIAKDQWKFSADGTKAEYAAGFEPGRIYEVVYRAKDPVVAALGAVAIRDYMSYIRQRGETKRILGFGNSQSGRFLRTFLYDGFNTDEQGARVFDGLWAHVSGAGRGDFNNRFAQPSRSDGMYPLVMAPFTDEGLLAKSAKDHTVPKIFLTNSSVEYWGRAAALTHITPDGKRDVEPTADTRIYYLTGAPHGPAGAVVRTNTQNLTNPLDYRPAMRALLIALNAWVADGKQPPASRIPRIGKDELTAPSALAFPKIPGVAVPKDATVPNRMDFGPKASKGMLEVWPPKLSTPYALLLPQVDVDGNEVSGIRLPDQQVPLATLTGWNLRTPGIGGAEMRLPLTGSFLPFARTKSEREASGDPRLSIEERYRDATDYLSRIEGAANKLVADRYMLRQDVGLVMATARDRWSLVMGAARAAAAK